MKPVFILLLLISTACTSLQAAVFTVPALAKDTPEPAKKPVRVTSWSSRAIYILDSTYFNETKEEIIRKTGQAKFDDIRRKCAASGWPAGMYESTVDNAEAEARMNRLNMYLLAVYQHRYKGNVFDKYAIIEVPYAGNENWDTAVKWEGSIYFLIKENDVKLLQ